MPGLTLPAYRLVEINDSDTFAESIDTPLESHIADVGGGSWIVVHWDASGDALTCIGGSSICRCVGSTGILRDQGGIYSKGATQGVLQAGTSPNHGGEGDPDEHSGAVFRYSDVNNLWYLKGNGEIGGGLPDINLVKIVAGVESVVAALGNINPSSVEIVFDETLIEIVRISDSMVLASSMDTHNASATGVGFRMRTDRVFGQPTLDTNIDSWRFRSDVTTRKPVLVSGMSPGRGMTLRGD